jgi:hypothetical protein
MVKNDANINTNTGKDVNPQDGPVTIISLMEDQILR